jgi:hypothetical protein
VRCRPVCCVDLPCRVAYCGEDRSESRGFLRDVTSVIAMKLYLWLCAALLLMLLAPAGAAPVRTEVRFRPLANLIYQLDAVSELLPGDPLDYRNLWNQEFLKTPEDRATLAEWQKLRRRYGNSIGLPVEGEFALETPQASVSFADKLRLASFQAKSRPELLERLELVLAPADVVVVDRVLRHFEKPFAIWWKREALAQGTAFSKSLERLLKRPDLRSRMEQFRAFYEARQPEGSVCSFNLMYRPDVKSGSTSGQQLENYSVVEFLPGEKPEERMDVVIHELCHYFYSLCPPESFARLQKQFLASGNPGSVPAFLLMNEGLATAFGNGILARSLLPSDTFEKLMKKPLSLYNNEGIDRTGKVMITPLDRLMSEKKTISDPAFIETYLTTLTAEFGPSLTAPRRFMTNLFLFIDAPLGTSLPRQVRQTLSVGGMYASVGSVTDSRSFEDYGANPNLSALSIVRAESLPALGAQLKLPESSLEALKNAAARNGTALFGYRRSPNAIGVILVAPNPEQAGFLLPRLRDAPEYFEGVLPITQ